MPGAFGFNFGATPDRQAVFEFFLSNMEQFTNQFKEVLYPGLMWDQVIPAGSIESGINPGANMMSYPIMDWLGQAGFRARFGRNIPTVGLTFGKNNIPIQAGGVGAVMDTDEIRAVMMGMQLNLQSKLPEIMKKAILLHIEGTFFYGDEYVNFMPFLDFPGVSIAVAAQGAGGSTLWVNKTPQEVAQDINSNLTSVWVNSRQIHMPNTVYLPSQHYGYIATTPMVVGADAGGVLVGQTILDYVLKNNICTNSGRGQLQIKPLQYLGDAGLGGTARMIICETKPDNFVMPYPMPMQLLAPQFYDFDIKLFAEYKFGSVHLPYPKAFLYVDEI